MSRLNFQIHPMNTPHGHPIGYVSLDGVPMVSYGSTPRDNVYYETYGAVASSSGQGGMEARMEEHISSYMKKVQSKDLKSGCLIGKGPSSIVYETTLEGKSYARKDLLRVPSYIFEREAAALVGLNHPNVLQTYCWTVDEGSCSLVVELMDNDLLTLMQKIKDSRRKQSSGSGSASQTTHLIDRHKFIKDGRNAPTGTVSESAAAAPLVYPFDLPEVLKVMVQVADGVKFLHDKGVAHGDLKPKNILVTSNEAVSSSSLGENMAFKVADFGLFWTKMKSRTLVSRRARNLELAQWRAPELLELTGLRDDEHESSTDSDWDSDSSDETIGELTQKFTFEDMARADIYNFALTCSQILTGEDPYPELSLKDLVRGILGGLRPGLPPTCPAQLRSLLERCWGEKTKRPSFEDIFSELKDLQASLIRADAVVDYKSSMTESSASRIDTFELELVPEHSAASGQPGGGPESSSAREIHQIVDVPIGLEKHSTKDNQADCSEGMYVLKQQRIGGKALGLLRKARSSLMRKMMSNVSIEKKKKKGISSPTKFSVDKLNRRPPELYVLHGFSSSDIKRMTNDFNEENIIHREGRTTVYKGIQAGTGATVAVMRLQKGSKGAFEVVKREIAMMSRVHHNNVMGLVGFCCEKKENMLVYEHLPNGTLRDWLHGSKFDSPLDWDRRLGIALCAARGLAHLHAIDPPIIHRYINSLNILLDKKLLAKVKLHFGLSLLVPYDNAGSLQPTIDETMGYRNPKDDIMNERSDVYSFGAVLLELLTGRPPNDDDLRYSFREVRNRYETVGITGVQELLDPALADIPEEELEEFLKIALGCVEDASRERPSMAEVMNQLVALVQSILMQYSIDLQLVWFPVEMDSFKIFLKESWED